MPDENSNKDLFVIQTPLGFTVRVSSPLKICALMLRGPQHERGNGCTTRDSAHPEALEGRAESLFQRAVSVHYWATIVGKHPDLADRIADVQSTLREPEEVRQSRRDPAVLLFYRSAIRRGRWVVAVAKHQDGEGFLVTAYRTDAIKEGERLWPK